ncbi:MAG: Rieske (2Fe-2S) region [Aeromicrobium sp.]|nr:Rieske (2Fe-2S) region [Aeromicrobium sp.]
MPFRSTGQPVPAEGQMATVIVGYWRVTVANVGGRLYAFDDFCSHQRCSLSGGNLEGTEVVCPCHMGTFDIASGAVVSGLPREPLRTWPVVAVDGLLEIDS